MSLNSLKQNTESALLVSFISADQNIYAVNVSSCLIQSIWASVKNRQAEHVFSGEPGRATFRTRTWTGITSIVQRGCKQLWQPQAIWIMVQMCFVEYGSEIFPITNTHSYCLTGCALKGQQAKVEIIWSSNSVWFCCWSHVGIFGITFTRWWEPNPFTAVFANILKY